ncbi:MAG: M16 family metallopeptidase [Candidatus Methylomirabilia bacterium]
MKRQALAVMLGLTVLVWIGAPAVARATGAVTRTRFPNGMTVLVRENPTAPVVAISLAVRMGTRWESRETAGISNFLQFMVVRGGTTSRSGIQIVRDAERLGGSIDAVGDVDSSEISATALSRHWVALLELVADVALHPSLPGGLIEGMRRFLLFQIRNRGEKPYSFAFDTLRQSLFGSHPYAWDRLGLPESVKRIDRSALIAHYRRHYVPGGMVLAVSGQVRAPAVVAEAERLFGSMPVAPPPAPPSVRLPAPAAWRAVNEVPGAQAQVLVGALAPLLTHPDYPAMKLLSTLLGGGMASRFFSELRDKQALAYSTGMFYLPLLDAGYFVAQLGTAPENLRRAEGALLRELERIRRQPPTAEEVRLAKAYLLGRFAMDRRTNARQARDLASFELAGVGYEFLDRYVAAVRRLTAADIRRAAQSYLGTVRVSIARPPTR